MAQNEGAKFWLQVLTELKNRGVKDMLIACVDGLKGFPEAIEAVYPRTEVQLCIVHLVRDLSQLQGSIRNQSFRFSQWHDRTIPRRGPKPIACD